MIGQQDPKSFVARIWLESGSNGEPLWRGHVRHVQGGHEAYFQNLTEMSEFLGRISGVPGPGTRPRAGGRDESRKAGARTGRKGRKGRK